jgi:hypothetical protein
MARAFLCAWFRAGQEGEEAILSDMATIVCCRNGGIYSLKYFIDFGKSVVIYFILKIAYPYPSLPFLENQQRRDDDEKYFEHPNLSSCCLSLIFRLSTDASRLGC